MENKRVIIKAYVELIATLFIAFWVIYRLQIDSMNYIDGGWNTTIQGPAYMKLKISMLIATFIFFLYRIVVIIRTLLKSKKDSQ